MAGGAGGGPLGLPAVRGSRTGEGEEGGRHRRVPRGRRLRPGHRRLLRLQRGRQAARHPQEGPRQLREEAQEHLQADDVPAADVRGPDLRGPGGVQGEDVRAGTVAALGGLALAAGALGLSCKTYKDQGEVLPPGYEAGVYTPPPDRQVFDDGGLIRGGGGGSMGGMGVLNNEGGNPAADATSGGGQDQGGGGVVLDAGADGSGS